MKLVKKETINRDYFVMDSILYVQLERNETIQDIKDELDIGWRDCPHSHDCCGCWGYNIYGKIVHMQDRIYRFHYHGMANV